MCLWRHESTDTTSHLVFSQSCGQCDPMIRQSFREVAKIVSPVAFLGVWTAYLLSTYCPKSKNTFLECPKICLIWLMKKYSYRSIKIKEIFSLKNYPKCLPFSLVTFLKNKICHGHTKVTKMAKFCHTWSHWQLSLKKELKSQQFEFRLRS